MCLKTIEAFEVKQKYAWKLFRKKDGKNIFQLFKFFGNHEKYPINRWIKNESKIKMLFIFWTGTPYKNGFHCFLNKTDAKKYKKLLKERDWYESIVLKKIKIGKILETGYEGFTNDPIKTIVTDKILITK